MPIPEAASQIAGLIQMTLVPVIMISAVGLICLVIQNRHGVVVDRIYRLNRERLELCDELSQRRNDDPRVECLRFRLDEVTRMTHLWLRRGVYTRNALAAAFFGILLFGTTSLWLVAAAVLGIPEPWDYLGLVLFVGGLLAFLTSFWFVLIDLQQSLTLSKLDTDMTDLHLRRAGRAPPRAGG